MRKTVALIMPALNEARNVAVTFDSIFASTRLPDEIIVADAFSTDDTRARVAAYADRGVPVRIVDNELILPGAGRNAAARAASADILLLVDFGNIVEPRWIEEMARRFEENSNADIVAGTFAPYAESDFEHCVAAIVYHKHYIQDRYSKEERIAMAPKRPTPGGLSVGYTRAIWMRAGGQPEWLRTSEDVLFSRRLVAMGANIVIQPEARVLHHMRGDAPALFRQIYQYGRGYGRTRTVSGHFLKLVGVYGALAALAAAGFLAPVFWLVAIALFAAYFFHAGPRKLAAIDGKIKNAAYLKHALAIVLARDFGTLLGVIAGWADWIFAPRFRRLFDQYTSDTDRRDYAFFPNR